MEGVELKPQRVWPWWLVVLVVIGIGWCFLLLVSSAEAGTGWWWRSAGNGQYLRVNSLGANDGYYYSRVSSCGCNYACGCRQYSYRKTGPVSGAYGSQASGGWRGQVLELLKTRQEQQDWLESLQLLGLEAPQQVSGYGYGSQLGYSTQLAGNGTQAIVPYAQQGSTVYGYSAFGQQRQPDIASLYNQAGRLTSQAQELAGQAATDFSSLVQQEGANQSRVAEILARGQAAAQIASSLDGPPEAAEFRSFQFRADVSPTGQINVQPLTSSQASGASADRWLTAVDLLRQSCIGCHTAEDPKGGLDLSDVAAWTDEQRRNWGPRIQASVVSGSMPKGDGQLSAEDRLGIVLGF